MAQLFCKHLGLNAEPVAQESPDFVISTEGRILGLEVTQVRQPGEHDKSVKYDMDFRLEVCRQWLQDQAVNRFGLSFRYRKRDRVRYMVPVPKDRPEVVKELKTLVSTLSLSPNRPVTVLFRGDSPAMAESSYGRRFFWVDENEFPVLHRYIQSLRVIYHPGHVGGLHTSNLSAGMSGISEPCLRKQINDKLGKLHKDYRNNVPRDAEIHLLLWSTGRFVTQRFHRVHVQCIQAIVQEESLRSDGGFDAVWWGDNLLMGDGPHEFIELT